MSAYSVILVPTTSHAIQGERALKQAGRHVKLVPIPRRVSSDCGSAIRIATEDRAACLDVLRNAGVEIDRVVDLE